MPQEKEAAEPVEREDRTDSIVDAMFGDDDDAPEDAPEKEVEDVDDDTDPNPDEEEESTDAEEDEDPESEEEEDEPDPNAEEDYDKPLKGKKGDKKGEKGTEEADPEADPKDETMARKMAKENGRKLKEEAAAHQTTKLDLQREREAREKLERDLAETKKVKADPKSDPEYQKLHRNIITNVRESAELLTGVKAVSTNFGTLVNDYLAARSAGDKRSEQIEALRSKIIEKCVISDVPYEEMDDSERHAAMDKANKVMKILRDNADPVQQALDLADKLEKDAEEGSYVLNEREYSQATESIKPLIEGFGDLADDVIEASPHAIESIVSKMVKESPAAKRRADAAKKDILEFLAGPRPLSKTEVDRMKAEGQDVKAFEKDRRAAFEAKKKKLAAHLFYGLMTRATFPEMAKELAELKGKKQDEESEIDTLLNVTGRKAAKKAPKKQEKEKVGTSAREKLFGGFDEDDD